MSGYPDGGKPKHDGRHNVIGDGINIPSRVNHDKPVTLG
jgi:hypothetical protein